MLVERILDGESFLFCNFISDDQRKVLKNM